MNPLAVLLHEPLIPANTGNIGRLCAAFETPLHLVHPLGFEISDKRVRRAGLDYWPFLNLWEHSSLEVALSQISFKRILLFETYGEKGVFHVSYEPGDLLLFGKETTGFSEKEAHDLSFRYPLVVIRIPYPSSSVRSLNLSNSVGIALSYAYHQVVSVQEGLL